MADQASRRVRLGMLTPSSNTVLEPVTTAMLAPLDEVSVHFARFAVTRIAGDVDALGQFALAPMLAAARLLADARVDVICWNGTAAGWLGFEHDRALCQAITEATGIAACSSVLALNEIFEITNVSRFALVTPYSGDIQQRIMANYADAGRICVAERHLGIEDNFAFSEIAEDDIAAMVGHSAVAEPQAITIFCTNLRGAPVVPALEAALSLPIYDTVATAVWAALRTAGVKPSRIQGWGRLFNDLP